MSNDILNKKISDSPEPLTYATGAIVEFKMLSYRVNSVTGGFIANLRLQPNEIIDWPETDGDEPDVSQLPLIQKSEFFMDNQPSALREFAETVKTYAGIEVDDGTLGDLLNEMRGAAVTFFVSSGPNERGDYRLYWRHNQ